eukprot:1205780-Rhodomonas_salina.3
MTSNDFWRCAELVLFLVRERKDVPILCLIKTIGMSRTCEAGQLFCPTESLAIKVSRLWFYA